MSKLDPKVTEKFIDDIRLSNKTINILDNGKEIRMFIFDDDLGTYRQYAIKELKLLSNTGE